jgi:hypothetical protein
MISFVWRGFGFYGQKSLNCAMSGVSEICKRFLILTPDTSYNPNVSATFAASFLKNPT